MRFQTNYVLIILSFMPMILLAQNSSDTSAVSNQENLTPKNGVSEMQKVISKSVPTDKNDIAALEIQNPITVKKETPVTELHQMLQEDLERINKELTALDLKYRTQRILKIQKEEIEFDLAFLKRLENIRETIAYETTGSSENFIIAADQFLDTLFNENTNVSAQFKNLSQERYDNYLTQDKIVKFRINDVKIEKVTGKNSTSNIKKYSGFAVLPNYGKKIKVEFFSDGLVRKADEKLMYEVAKEDNIEQTVTIEGVIENFQHGRVGLRLLDEEEILMSIVTLQEWIIMERKELVREFEQSKKNN